MTALSDTWVGRWRVAEAEESQPAGGLDWANAAEDTEDGRFFIIIMPRKSDADEGELKIRGLQDSFVL